MSISKCLVLLYCLFFFFKQKTAYELRISDWSSDVCSSDLAHEDLRTQAQYPFRRKLSLITDAGQIPQGFGMLTGGVHAHQFRLTAQRADPLGHCPAGTDRKSVAEGKRV